MTYVPLTGFLRRGPQQQEGSGWFVHAERASPDDVPAVIITGPRWFVRLVRKVF